MDKEKFELILNNEREWRKHTFELIESINTKVDATNKELETFKIRVIWFASVFGTATGLGSNMIFKIFTGTS